MPKPGDIAGPYAAKNHDGQAEGLTLEKLRITLRKMSILPGTGQGWFEWGVTWGRHKSYPKLGDFQADLGIDKGSRVLDPAFANLNALDCRLKPEVMAACRARAIHRSRCLESFWARSNDSASFGFLKHGRKCKAVVV